ncbi:MAG TPA: tRNA (adenosine(37)-N6)-threonylcarbamoyltransferase complex transferase subunit TsaD [Acidobacteriota bacterium]|nr:tRNA (adenosine(37)-N6)-threonylcarbamoyltransferase complex transferase subunit TsaD [Acidobacteriota bacterium]HNH81437.1 tRNA (adenosine(37)-N6)-threonylcarbamoyltransferase complex transferase subunit TsaD [Acidobacteriota bacterium]
MTFRYVLGIESSCDETAASVLEHGTVVRSNIIASQIETHRPFGGVVPEVASREHLKRICDVVEQALTQAEIEASQLDGIAVTCGPGLIGSLLVGVSYAKALAYALQKPLIGIHHIEGHIYSVVFEHPPIQYPALALIVSGGHTNLFWIPEENHYIRLGHTRDDAAGEAYDKTAKLLGLGYPGGPVIDRLAKTGVASEAPLTYRPPHMPDAPYDFSFSGLKTAVLRFVQEHHLGRLAEGEEVPAIIRNLSASFQKAVVTSLTRNLLRAARDYPPKTIILAGGVACNSALREAMKDVSKTVGVPVVFPSPVFTTDNAAMIAAAGYVRLQRGETSDLKLAAEPTLKLHSEDASPAPSRGKKRFRS